MGPTATKYQTLLMLSSMIFTLSLLGISSFCFVYNFARIFKLNAAKKRLIEVGCTFMIVCMMFDMATLMGALNLLRMNSCYKQDYVWPGIIFCFEMFCKYLPIYCFTSFFSTKLSLYSQN